MFEEIFDRSSSYVGLTLVRTGNLKSSKIGCGRSASEQSAFLKGRILPLSWFQLEGFGNVDWVCYRAKM